MAEGVLVATPPRMVCKNCGLGIFNQYPLGHHYLHTVTGEHECKRGKRRNRSKSPSTNS